MSNVKTEPKPENASLSLSLDELAFKTSSPTPSTSKRRLEAQAGPVDAKRKRREDQPTSPDDSPPQTAQKKSTDFWYSDGNVVIAVGGTVFKLYRARLARFSTVFAARFDSGLSQDVPKLEGCPVYEVDGLRVEDFEQFLAALETPFKFTSAPPSQPILISILRASHVLSCPAARDLAVSQLRALWPANDATLPGGRRTLQSAISIVRVSRECDVPELRKRAFYEIVRSNDFWNTLEKKRENIALPDADLLALCQARSQLQRLWFTLVFTPPFGANANVNEGDEQPVETSCGALAAAGSAGGGGRRADIPGACASRLTKAAARKGIWRSDMVDRWDFEKGRRDPIGHLQVLLNERRAVFDEAGWCETCMAERRKAWTDAQTKWWAVLDKWFTA